MDVLEVEGVCSVFGDVLHVAVDIVDSLTSVGVIFTELFTVNHLEVGLHIRVDVYPDINETVHFPCMVLPEFRVLRTLLPHRSLAVL